MITEDVKDKQAIFEELSRQLNNKQDIQRYITAGRATFTIVSKASGTRFTFKVSEVPASVSAHNKYVDAVNKHVQNSIEPNRKFFVALLAGPNNEGDFRYIGMLEEMPARDVNLQISYRGLRFYLTRGSRCSEVCVPPSVKAFKWLAAQLSPVGTQLDAVEFWHSGRCGRCGRKLTVPSSIALGLGPECASK